MKPPNSCSGKGIKLERNFDNILKILGGPERTEKTYVIQKYIGKISLNVYLNNFFYKTLNRLIYFRKTTAGIQCKGGPTSVLSNYKHISNTNMDVQVI